MSSSVYSLMNSLTIDMYKYIHNERSAPCVSAPLTNTSTYLLYYQKLATLYIFCSQEYRKYKIKSKSELSRSNTPGVKHFEDASSILTAQRNGFINLSIFISRRFLIVLVLRSGLLSYFLSFF